MTSHDLLQERFHLAGRVLVPLLQEAAGGRVTFSHEANDTRLLRGCAAEDDLPTVGEENDRARQLTAVQSLLHHAVDPVEC